MGDDAAVVNQSANRDLIITTDLLIENVDFYRDAAPAGMLGHRALAVSLSDIAAMGARPFWSLLSIGMPTVSWETDFTAEFFAGYFALADQFGVTLSGGDVSEAKEGIVIDSILLGEAASGLAVLRSGAQPGDQIFVTGTLGGAAAGLKLIEMGARIGATGLASLPRASKLGIHQTKPEGSMSERDRAPTDTPQGLDEAADSPPAGTSSVGASINMSAAYTIGMNAIESLLLRQLRPSPRVGWGIVLGEERLATSMIDISDGLSSDLAHLCEESDTGALIDSSSLPIDRNVIRLCGRRGLDPLMLALHGGEDFELLFTVAPADVTRLPKKVDGVEISRIGEINDRPGEIRIAEKNRVWDLTPGGFEHFAKND